MEAFLRALTIGWNHDAMGSSKPIEMQSHDPTRYAGDMLAWLHQATASEKEYLRSLTSEKGNFHVVLIESDTVVVSLNTPV